MLVADEETRAAAVVVDAFVKAIKAFRYYPADYPLLKEFYSSFARQLDAFLRQYSALILDVTESAFAVSGHPVHQTEDLKSSIPFVFFRDGIRVLRFLDGVQEWELMALIDSINQSDTAGQLEDDLVTLLWEKELLHIDYQAVDDFLEETPLMIPDTVEQFREKLSAHAMAQSDEAAVLRDMLEGGAQDGGGRALPAQPFSLLIHRQLLHMEPEELQALQQEVHRETSPSVLDTYADFLFDMLSLVEDHQLYQTLVDAIQEILDHHLAERRLAEATHLLARARKMLNAPTMVGWKAAILQPLREGLGQPRRIERIGHILYECAGEGLEEARELLAFLPRQGIPPLIRLMRDIQHLETRALLRDIVSGVARENLDQLAAFLTDQNSEFVIMLVGIIGEIADELALPYLLRAFQHRDARVRRLVARSVSRIDGPQAEGLLIHAVHDADEGVRRLAALYLGQRNSPNALGTLMNVVRAREFSQRSPEEISAFLDAIAMTARPGVVDLLQELLHRQSLLGRRRTDTVRQCAAFALVTLGTPKAFAVLQEGAASAVPAIRQACEAALARMPSTTMSSGADA
jgi:hypothetical protein